MDHTPIKLLRPTKQQMTREFDLYRNCLLKIEQELDELLKFQCLVVTTLICKAMGVSPREVGV